MKKFMKMRSLMYLILPFLIFPFFVFAAVDHSYSSEDTEISSPMLVHVTADDYDTDINCGGLQFWGIQVVEHITGETFFGSPRFVPASILSQEFTINAPPGDYEEITFICSDDSDNIAFQLGSIEKDLAGDQIIFSIPSDTTIIVSDTNAESLTSPIPLSDEIATSTIPKVDIEVPSLSADTDEVEVITSEF